MYPSLYRGNNYSEFQNNLEDALTKKEIIML